MMNVCIYGLDCVCSKIRNAFSLFSYLNKEKQKLSCAQAQAEELNSAYTNIKFKLKLLCKLFLVNLISNGNAT